MKAIALLILASTFFVTAGAQPNPDTLWTRTYGGSDLDAAWSVRQTADGGYVVAGRTYSVGASIYDFYLVKTDSSGDTLWTRTCGGDDGDYAYSVQQTADGGYILAGSTNSFGVGRTDIYLVRMDSGGDTLWTRTYGGNNHDYAHSVEQTSDSGFILAGSTVSFGMGVDEFYLVKTDSQGDTLWTHTYGGISNDVAYSVQLTTDGGYVVAGYSESFGAGYYDFYLVKIDSLGDTLWTKTYGGSSSDRAYSVQQTNDGGYVVAGYTSSFGTGLNDFYLVKTDSQGDTLWTRTYGGDGDDIARSVQQAADGGYVLAGSTESFGVGDSDFYLVKTNNQGDSLWTRIYGGNDLDAAWSVRQTADGGYVVAGRTASFGAGDFDFYVVKTGPEPQGSEPIEVSIPEQYMLYPNFPNPFNATTQIVYELPKAGRVSLSVFNLLGEEVTKLADGMQTAGRHTVDFNGSGLASGVYLYRLQAEGFVQAKKMVLLK